MSPKMWSNPVKGALKITGSPTAFFKGAAAIAFGLGALTPIAMKAGAVWGFLSASAAVASGIVALIGWVYVKFLHRVDHLEGYQAALVTSSQDAIIGKDLAGIVTSWNPGAERIFGWSADDMIGRSITVLVPSDRREEEARILASVSRGERVESYETLRLRKDGKLIAVSVTVSPIRDGAGRIVGASKIARDVTGAKEARDRLAADSLKEIKDLRTALDEHAIVAITDAAGKITYVNDKFCAISKFSREELLGRDHRIINSRYHPKEFIKGLWDTIQSGSVWRGEIKNRAKDGTYYWVDTTIVPFLGEDGKPRQYVAIRADITARKQVEETLLRQKDELILSLKEVKDLRTALDEHAIVAITDAAGKITYVNDKFCAISKFSREELLGRDHRIINSRYHPKEFIKGLWDTIQSGRVWRGEIKNRAKDGTYYWVDTTIMPFLGEDGKPRQYVAIRADITERKRVEESLREQKDELARSNADLEQFAYAASHDLQEPLRAVAGCVQVLQSRYKDKLDERGNELIGHAVDGANRMKELIDGLLDYSRVTTRGGKLARVESGRSLAAALENLASSIQESGAEVAHGELPTVNADAPQLTRLFQNLIGNAVKFRGGGTPKIHVSAEKEGKQWVFLVKDNGIGIATEHLERIFVLFQRLHTRNEYPGTGIGLALCKKIVERHGGRIWAEPGRDGGSAFRFTLPE